VQSAPGLFRAMMVTTEPEMEKQSAPGTLVLQVIGVGGAGCNAVSQLCHDEFEKVRFAVCNTDAAALARSVVETKLVLGAKSTRGLGAGGDPERGRAAALEEAERLRALCAGVGVVFLVAGLGGGTGTGAAPVLARMAKEAGALVLGIVILPFECEGSRRNKQAQAGFQELRAAADAVICLPNQKVFRFIDENTSVVDAFAITNEFVAQAIRAIYRLLTRPGLINVDFGDLAAITCGKHSETSLATAEASGESRAREVVEKLLCHPLLETTQPLAEASAVLVSIAGGLDLTMGEVNRIMEQVNRHCEQAHIILGAAIDDNLAGRISVTLLASAPGAAPVSDLPPAQPLAREAGEPGSPFAARPGARPVIVPGPPHESALEPAAPATPNANGRVKRAASRMRQGQLPLEIVSKGRFEKSEPTIFQGQDLDVPTYIRRGIALN